MSLRFTYQTQDPEIVRENFKKIKDFINDVALSGNGEIVFFENVDSLVIDWTIGRKNSFGDFPLTELWTEFGGVYHKNDIAAIIDAPPPGLTTITFDFLGKTGAQGSGFLIIGNGGDSGSPAPPSNVWGTITGTLPDQIDLQNALDLKLNITDYNQHFVGKYTTLAALQAAYPTANAGDYGQVDAGAGHDVVNYNWDAEDGWILGSAGSGATNTDALPEGSTNLYFTSARAQASISGTANRISVTAGVIDIAVTYVGQSSINTVGTIGTGTWQADAIASGYGGTGLSTYATGDILYASATNVLSKLSVLTDGYVLTLAGGVPTWAAASGGSSLWAASGSDIYYEGGKVSINFSGGGEAVRMDPNTTFGIGESNPAYSFGVPSSVGRNSAYKVIAAYRGSTELMHLNAVGDMGISGTFGSAQFTAGRNNPSGAPFQGNNANGPSFLGTAKVVLASGTNSINIFTATGTANGAGINTIRGFYANYSITSLPNGKVIGFENTIGDNLFCTTSGSVGIGATTTIDPSAIFQVTSSAKGCLFSRISTSDAAAIASKAESLFMYDTTLKKYKFWNGSAFEIISSS